MNVTLSWKPDGTRRGAVESTGRRFVIKGAAVGGQEMLDRREGKRYRSTHAAPLRLRAEALVAEEATLPPRVPRVAPTGGK